MAPYAPMDLGIVIRPERDPETLVEEARRAEAARFDELWLWEDCFFAGGIAACATALAVTERIVVGLGIMPAPTRNPAFAAMEVAALARLHPGRFHAGIGHGVADWMRQVGAKPASQLTLLEETVGAVRALLAGETVDLDGRYVRLRDVTLGHPPRVVPPVSVGVRGPKSLALSGRCADGTVLDALSSPGYVRWAREQIGRTEGHRLTVFAFCATDAPGLASVERQLGTLRERGGPQADALGDGELPVAGGGRDDPFVRALADAGADCVVLVAPDPAVPLDVVGT